MATSNTVKLKHLATKIGSGLTPKGGRQAYVNDGIPFIRSQNVNHNRLLQDSLVFITEEQDASMSGSRVHPGDVLLNITGASIGRTCVVPENMRRANVNQHVCIIRTNGNVNAHFLQAYLASPKGQHEINRLQAGGGRQGINFQQIGNVRVPQVDHAHQNYVVNILSTVDRAMERTGRLIEAKRKLKKGLAQQLLTGQRRLPGFKASWTTHRLDTISNIGKGAGGSKADLVSDGLPVVRYGELYTTYDVRIDEAVSFVSPDAAKRSKPIKRGDVLLAGSGEDRIEIGTAAAYMNGEPAYAGGDIVIVSPTDANSVFLAYLLDSNDVRREFYRRAQGESVVHLYMRDVAGLELRLPSIEEQDRIAVVLGAADREIALLEKKLATLSELKRGLMQKLLTDPSATKA